MPTSKPVKREASVPEAAQALGLSTETIRRDIKDGAPHDLRRDGAILLNIDEHREWREAKGRTGKRGRPNTNDSPEFADAKLLKLREEIRIKRAQADRDERRADVDRGTHQPLEQLREMLIALGSCLRAGVDRMQRRFGPQAAVEFNQILDEFGALVRKHAGSMGDLGGGGQGSAAAEPS